MKLHSLLIALSILISSFAELPAYCAETPVAMQSSQAKKSNKKKSGKKTKKTSAAAVAETEVAEETPKVVEPPKRPRAIRGDEVLILKSKKDGDSKLYGYENDGPKYYWWAEAHRMGEGKDQLNLGYETQWVITPQYTRVSKYFSEGLAAVELNGKVGFIDRYNRFIIPPSFEPIDNLEGFHYGLAVVKKDGKYGFINKAGEFVIPPTYDNAENFGDDYLAVVKTGNKFGCIDLTGDLAVPCEHIAKEVMKMVPGKNKQYRAAKKLAKERWDQGYYANAQASVMEVADNVNQKINDTNYVEPTGDNAPSNGVAADDGIYIISNSQGLYGASDSYGRPLLPCTHKNVKYDRTQRLFIVESSITTPEDYTYNGVGLAYPSGGWVIPPVFDKIGNFNATGYAPVEVGLYSGEVDVFGYVDEQFLEQLLNASINEKGTVYTRRLVGILPTCAPAHNCLGIYYAAECDNLRDAIHHFTVAHRLDPENKDFENNMKEAKSTRNNRRWNRVLTGMSIAATVLSIGAVTYSAVSGNSMDMSSFSNSSAGFSSGTDTSYDSSGSSSGHRASSGGTGRCQTCMGSGTCSSKSYAARKRYCHGSGLCGFCNGTGWLAAGGDRADCTQCDHGECRSCKGSGKCRSCNGSGKA